VRGSFDRGGVTLSVASGSARLVLVGGGRGGRLMPVRLAALVAWRNSVAYRRGGVVEWYRSGPLGLEQGFTLKHRPTRGSGEVAIGLRVGGSLRAGLAHGDVVFLTRRERVALRYDGLSAVDAAGRRLPTHIELRGALLTLRVADLGARYPLRIDPFIQRGAKLTGADEISIRGGGLFGASVAISSDGKTALIGGPGDTVNQGAAWVFTRSGSTWAQQGLKLTGTGETSSGFFGTSVALSADGNTALIGGPHDNNNLGAAWVFTRSGSTWTQQGAKLTGGTDETGQGSFGSSVALSAGGNTALIGGPWDNSLVGAAWVFARSGSTWAQQGAKLTGSDETGSGLFGGNVALSADGNTALIGAPSDEHDVGAAWAFANPPAVSAVSPSVGPPAGGTAVTITGSRLGGASTVAFGSTQAASFVINSPNQITAISPPRAIGPVHVTVTTSDGTSAAGSADTFAYATAPGAPTGLLANAGDGRATVAFAAPAANGSPITAYTVTALPSGAHATGPASPITVGGLRNGTTYTLTVTASNALGTGPPSAPSNPITPTCPPAVGTTGLPIPGAPELSGLSLSPAAFRAAPSGPTALAATSNKPQTGTLVSYTDSQAATTTFTVLQSQSGVRRGNRCVKAPQHPPTKPGFKRCTRLVALGSFTHTDRAGQNQLRFTGRISRRQLRPASYQLRAIARNPAGNTSPPRTTHFQIKR
jgi:hypothetical protein